MPLVRIPTVEVPDEDTKEIPVKKISVTKPTPGSTEEVLNFITLLLNFYGVTYIRIDVDEIHYEYTLPPDVDETIDWLIKLKLGE